MKILPVALLISAAAIGFCAVCLFVQEKQFAQYARRTHANVVAISPLGDHGQMVPVVEFYDEGEKLIRKQTQRFGAVGVKKGDEVEILYMRKKVLGLNVWNIFIVKDSTVRPYRLYTVFGVFFGVIAMILAAAGLIVWLC